MNIFKLIKFVLCDMWKEDSSEEEEQPKKDVFDYSSFNWCYGGFNGSKAKENPFCTIENLKISSNGLSYEWLKGGCEDLGATGHKDFRNTLACLFCFVDGEWVGGKFDWISTSRTTRDFKNIYDNYHGWQSRDIAKATRYAFVIVSKDGKQRSNVIFYDK